MAQESTWSFRCVHWPQLVSCIGCSGLQSLNYCSKSEEEEIRSLSMYNIYFCMHFMFIPVLLLCKLAWQKKASEPCIDGYQLPGNCLELNSGCLKEQPRLLLTEPSSLQAYVWQGKKHSQIQIHKEAGIYVAGKLTSLALYLINYISNIWWPCACWWCVCLFVCF